MKQFKAFLSSISDGPNRGSLEDNRPTDSKDGSNDSSSDDGHPFTATNMGGIAVQAHAELARTVGKSFFV
jgi:hypothetical protein